MWNVDWGKIVKDARMDYGMTQEELSWGICNVSTLSRIETGHTDPSLQNIEAIFNKLELSIPWWNCWHTYAGAKLRG